MLDWLRSAAVCSVDPLGCVGNWIVATFGPFWILFVIAGSLLLGGLAWALIQKAYRWGGWASAGGMGLGILGIVLALWPRKRTQGRAPVARNEVPIEEYETGIAPAPRRRKTLVEILKARRR